MNMIAGTDSPATKGTLAIWFSLVKFSHSIFALPFAMASAWLAAGGVPVLGDLGLIVLCAVAARTAAMAFNRLVDRDVDAKNKRTASREIPAGLVSPASAGLLTLGSSLLFIVGAFSLNRLSGFLAFPVLLVLLGYSLVKRISWSAHLVLGLSLGLAPLGAWVAVRGQLNGDLSPPLLLAAAVLTWVAGFDLIYSCQDAGFDREEGLHSIPARFGIPRALGVSSFLHLLTVALLLLLCWRAEMGAVYLVAVVVAACLLLWQHRLVSADDLSRVNMAFFTLNGWVGIGLFAGTAIDLALELEPVFGPLGRTLQGGMS
ncbi:MAG: 4-hydroxybenzoate polyprenyltransferase [Planctomycetota bacterium]|jgi:4-hydroxybenzoate polyprenyltransferase